LKVTKSLRYRVNVSTSVKGVKSWDCTVEVEGTEQPADAELIRSLLSHDTFASLKPPLEAQVVLLSDSLVKMLEKRYPITEVTK